jgi:hypothetical protein
VTGKNLRNRAQEPIGCILFSFFKYNNLVIEIKKKMNYFSKSKKCEESHVSHKEKGFMPDTFAATPAASGRVYARAIAASFQLERIMYHVRRYLASNIICIALDGQAAY